MRFTMIGHAAVYIETSGPSILLDPWLGGSCFYRSWWHYPPPAEIEPAWLSPDYLYVTHYHFDHLHYPSLRRLDKNAHALLGRFGVDVMAKELEGLGFRDVEEMPHGQVKTLAPGVRIASYQYGFDDTAVVIQDGEHTIFNCNDAKIKGRTLAQMVEDFGHPTFLWKNHSYSITYPLCYEAEDPRDLELVTRDSFSDDFIEVASIVKPEFAVPFASSIAFLHPQASEFNAGHISCDEVIERFEQSPSVASIRAVRMVSGDSWDSETGFDLSEEDWEEGRDGKLAALLARHRHKVEDEPVEADGQEISFDDFAAYVRSFCRALPPFAARILLARPIAFEFPTRPGEYWVIDFVRGQVTCDSELPENWASVVRCDMPMVADMIEKKILCNLVGTMRIRVRLARGGVNQDLAFWGLLIMWEASYLPLSSVMTPRFVRTLWARRREALDQLQALAMGKGSALSRLSQGFTPETKH